MFLSGSAYGLSCAWFPTFDELVEDSDVVLKATVTEVLVDLNEENPEFCEQQWGNAVPGTYVYTLDVSEYIKGDLWWIDPMVTRLVTDINCTRWGACTDMEAGEEYIILANQDGTLNGGLCSLCPYMPADEYEPMPPSYDPAEDPTCSVYNDGCNTCSKGPEGLAACTRMACFEMGDPYCIEFVEEPAFNDCICTMQYDPVCWVDGQTYGNACGAWCEQVEIAYAGECEFGEPWVCDRGYSWKICGVDGVTYADICDMEAEWVERAYDGECVANQPQFVDAPNFCASWYDGCNECWVEWWMLTMCTEKACFTMNRAKCMEFDFQQLTTANEMLIENVVNNRLNTATQDQKDQVIQKVADKIADINYTLSVSSFIIWSPALARYQFVLEILWKIDSLM